jgi:probable rRNA maturation factor
VKHAVTVVVDEPGWKVSRGLVKRIEEAACLAIERGRRLKRHRTMTILLSSDTKLRKLNGRFRSKDKATNVLSFPAAPNPEYYLGDVAIALGIVSREAANQRKTLPDHATHLAVHGVLHLLGYDHSKARDAHRMERLEAEILSELGIADPYESRPNRS